MRVRTALAASAALALLLTGCTGESGPGPDEPPQVSPLPPLADPLPVDQLADFGGVATMNAGSNCTGTLIDTGVRSGPAYILTNGHCAGGMDGGAQSTEVGQAWFGTAEFFRTAGNLDSTLTVDVEELSYTTMRHTDTAILRLDSTLGELEDYGVRAIGIADEEPSAGAEVVNIGVPVQNLFEEQWVMRRGECTLGAQSAVIEFFWLWLDVWSNDCPGIVQGSSGSPLLQLDADGAPQQIVAMINTTTWGASRDQGGHCWLNRPCEVVDGEPTMVEQTSYAQSVAGIGRCFDGQTGVFSLDGDCPLPFSDVWALEGGGPFRGGDLEDSVGRLPRVNLSGAEAGTVRTALIPLDDGVGCQDPGSYADAESHELVVAEHVWEEATVVPVALPEAEGWYLLCAVREQAYEHAASVVFEVDRTAPIIAADADVEAGEGGVLVRPHLNPPELATVRFAWERGDVACPDPSTFEDFFVVPLFIEDADLPATYCIYGRDLAGNDSDVTRVPIAAQ